MKTVSDRPDQPLIGCQNYWSSHPQIVELEKYTSRLTILRDDCNGLYRRLEQTELHYAFCSSISLARNADFEMALPLGIAHSGPSSLAYWGISNSRLYLKDYVEERVQKLREAFRSAQINRTENLKQGTQQLLESLEQAPFAKCETLPLIRFTNGSTSWSTLSRLLYKLIFGSEAYELVHRFQAGQGATISSSSSSSGESEMHLELRLENEALQRRCTYPAVIDLPEVWRAITGLPFVSTVLQKSRRAQPQNCRASLAEVTELAQMRMQIEPCTYLPDMLPRNAQQQSIDLCSLWKSLNYRLGADELRSLLVFLYLARPLEKKGCEDEAFTLKMLRWQQRGGSLATIMA